MIVALDTETTGLDLYHACRPFIVAVCIDHQDGSDWDRLLWEWRVNPLTREVSIPAGDPAEIQELLDAAQTLVLQNAKFDATALKTIGVDIPWGKVEDTLVAGHMLYTAKQHSLDRMVLQYLHQDITHHERHLRDACEEARRETRKKWFQETRGVWRIAERDMEGMPSSKDKMWQADMWLPLELATELEYPPDHPFYTVTSEYAQADPYWTLRLWVGDEDHEGMEAQIHRRQLWKIYRQRMKVLPIANRMEHRAVTGSIDRTERLAERFERHRQAYITKCEEIADQFDYALEMPKSGNNQSLTRFAFDVLGLPVLKTTESGAPAFDKEVIEAYGKELPAGSVQLEFIEALQQKRKLDTGLQYMQGYARFWIPLGIYNDQGEQAWFRIHPNLNPCGTVQLRWSSSNPNAQNISKQEGFNLRECFGPAPGREWWSLDAQNIELRIPTFESGERELIDIFLRPKDPPYYGSYHLAIFDLLHPDLFREHGVKCKDLFESTWYQWVKNGNFAVIYGCQRKKADATYKVVGAFDRIRSRFPAIARLSDQQIRLASTRGYVETIPDRTVDPDRGFPIMASRTGDGGVMPTTPLNYHVSGTAMWWTQQAMIVTDEQLADWRATGFDAWAVLQVHDELVFDLPLSAVDPRVDLEREKRRGGPLPDIKAYRSNLGRVRRLQRLMERCGDGIGIPTPVGVEYNRDNWAEVTLKC